MMWHSTRWNRTESCSWGKKKIILLWIVQFICSTSCVSKRTKTSATCSVSLSLSRSLSLSLSLSLSVYWLELSFHCLKNGKNYAHWTRAENKKKWFDQLAFLVFALFFFCNQSRNFMPSFLHLQSPCCATCKSICFALRMQIIIV